MDKQKRVMTRVTIAQKGKMSISTGTQTETSTGKVYNYNLRENFRADQRLRLKKLRKDD